MPGSLFSRLNRSFGSVPSRAERVAPSQEKVERVSKSFPLQLLSVVDVAPRAAFRDIEELIAAGVIEQEEAGGRSTFYRLNRAAKVRGQD